MMLDVEGDHPCLSADSYMPDNFLESLDEKEENEKRYHKSNFRYDEVRDTYTIFVQRGRS